jgi:hypothetical protein
MRCYLAGPVAIPMWLATLLLPTGCAREREATQPAHDAVLVRDTGAPATTSGSVDCVGLESSILVAEPTRAALRSAFGEPDSVISVVEPNRHVDGAIDSLFVMHYPGLLVSIRTPTGAADLADHVQVSDARYIRYPQLAMGAAASQVTAALGPPTRRTGDTLVYECGAGAEQPVTFILRSGVVRLITIDYYVD